MPTFYTCSSIYELNKVTMDYAKSLTALLLSIDPDVWTNQEQYGAKGHLMVKRENNMYNKSVAFILYYAG